MATLMSGSAFRQPRGLPVWMRAGRRSPREIWPLLLATVLGALLIWQLVRLLWTVITPLSPLGAWQPQAAVIASPAERRALFASFDPFFREAEAAKVREAAAAKYRTVERPPATAPPEVNRTSQTEAAAERRQIEGEVKKQLEAEHKKEQQVLTKAEEIEEQRQRELLDIAQGNHVERSAWHNIEVDSHGKVVQETSFEYGHEYYSERAKEVDPKAKQHVDIAAGEVALVAAALSGGASASTTPPASPSARTARAVPSGQGQSSASAKPASAQPQSVLKTVTIAMQRPRNSARQPGCRAVRW